MNILKYFDLVWFKNIFMQIINLRLMSLGRLSRGFPTWCVISILSMENDTLSDELFFKYRTLLHWCFIFFFSTTPVILKQFGLEYSSWSSSWLSNESTCYWRDGTFSNWISEICYLNDSLLNMIETAFWVAISSFERNFYRVSNACKSL